MVGTMKMVSIFSRIDHPQEFFGVEARHQHQRAAEAAGAQAERVRRGVIERPGQQRAGARLEAIDHRAHGVRALATCSGVGALRRTPLGWPVVPEV